MAERSGREMHELSRRQLSSCECVGTVYRASNSTHACVVQIFSVKPYAWKRKKGRYVEGDRLFGKWAPYVPACALWGPVSANFREAYDVPVARSGSPPPLFTTRPEIYTSSDV